MVKRTDYDNDFKFKMALAAIKGDNTYEEIATEYSISKSWRTISGLKCFYKMVKICLD